MRYKTAYLRVIAGLFGLLMTGGSTASAHDDHTIGLDANESPPYWSETMPKDGMCGEIVHAVSQAAGIVSHIHYKPLTRMIEDDQNNDLGNPAFYMGNQDFAAIIPICVYHVGLFYYRPNHPDGIAVRSIEDLRGYKVGILKGTLVDRAIFMKAGVEFEESYSQESLFKKLRRGRIDLVIEIDLVGQKIIDRLFPEQHDNFVATIVPRSDRPISIMISSGYPDAEHIGGLYKKGLQTIRASGIYQQILENYYGKGNVPEHFMKELDRFAYIYSFDALE